MLINLNYFNLFVQVSNIIALQSHTFICTRHNEPNLGSNTPREGSQPSVKVPPLFPTSDRKLKVYRAAASPYYPDLQAAGAHKNKRETEMLSNRDSVTRLFECICVNRD